MSDGLIYVVAHLFVSGGCVGLSFAAFDGWQAWYATIVLLFMADISDRALRICSKLGA